VRVAVTATIWGDSPFALVAEEARDAGYAGIEGVGDLAGNVSVARRVLADEGLEVTAGRFLANWFAEMYQDIEFDQLQRAAEFFADIGAQFLITSSRPVPERMLTAGHVTTQRQDGLLDYQWTQLADSLTKAAYVTQRDFELPLLFRNQLGSYVETGDELDQLISMTDPDTLRLAPDIGYLAYAGADPLAFVRRYFERIAYLTLKDLDADLHEQHIWQRGSLEEFWEAGGFLELGQGDVDVEGVVSVLRERGFDGWLAVGHDRPGRDPSASVQISRDYLVGLGLELEADLT